MGGTWGRWERRGGEERRGEKGGEGGEGEMGKGVRYTKNPVYRRNIRFFLRDREKHYNLHGFFLRFFGGLEIVKRLYNYPLPRELTPQTKKTTPQTQVHM